ncbi:MAG: hypothetical protein M1482_13730 [Chloroflexi bacterium]|nr:hypothetical protein [Chloroflexota bacterium]
MSIETRRDSLKSIGRMSRAFAAPFGAFLFARLWTFVLATTFWTLAPPKVTESWYVGLAPIDGNVDGWLWAAWQRWDTIWYSVIATRGYSVNDLSTAYFPLYPLLMRATAEFVRINDVAAGMIVSSLAALGAFVLLYRLTIEEYGERAARLTLTALVVFPTAFFLMAAYSESLFLFLALAAWTAARRNRWGWAGVLGALAALTRAQGMLLALPLLALFVRQWRRGEVRLRAGLWLALVVAGGLAFLFYLFQTTQSLAAWLQVERYWREFAFPWEPVWESLVTIFTVGDFGLAFLNALDLGLTVLFLVWMVVLAQRRCYAQALYLAIIILPPLFAIARFSPHLPLASMSRFLLVAFPAFGAMAAARVRPMLRASLFALSFLTQVLLLMLFTHWIFAG